MLALVGSLQEKHLKKASEYEVEATAPLAATGIANIYKRKAITQITINNVYKKNLREEACQDIALFFYNNAIPFNVANSEEYKKMFESVARHGLGFKPPSYHEVRVKYLKLAVEKTNHSLEEHKDFWKKSGCTIMTDGWIDRRRRTILNFLVNSPLGTIFLKYIDASSICKTADKVSKMKDDIVEEVGEENVIQVVTGMHQITRQLGIC